MTDTSNNNTETLLEKFNFKCERFLEVCEMKISIIKSMHPEEAEECAEEQYQKNLELHAGKVNSSAIITNKAAELLNKHIPKFRKSLEEKNIPSQLSNKFSEAANIVTEEVEAFYIDTVNTYNEILKNPAVKLTGAEWQEKEITNTEKEIKECIENAKKINDAERNTAPALKTAINAIGNN